MRVVKPNCLSLMTRPVEHLGQVRFCVSVMAMTNLRGDPFLFSEQNLWKTLMVAAPGFSEPGVLKSRSEFLVYGHARAPQPAPDQPPAASIPFGIRFGELRKVGRLHGRRVVEGNNLVHSEAPSSAPIDGSASYGGPEDLRNPIGRGHPSSRRPDGLLELPLVEGLNAPWDPKPERNVPFGFGPRDITHPERMALAGTYDKAWLENDFPGLARDGKWAIHNVGAPDQQQAEAFTGEEPYHLANLHPEEAQVQGRLPGLNAAMVVQRLDQRLERIPASLRTVVLLPDFDRVLLIWQGFCQCRLDDGGDIATVVIGAEHLGTRKPTSHYAEVLRLRTDSVDDMLESLRDDQLLPENVPFEGIIPADLDLNQPAKDDSLEARLRRRGERAMSAARDEVIRLGMDPAVHAPPAVMPKPPPLPKEVWKMGEFFRAIDRMADEKQALGKQIRDKQIAAAEKDFIAAGKDFGPVREEMAGGLALGPPKPNADRIAALFAEEQSRARALNVSVPALDQMVADPEMSKFLRDADSTRLQAYSETAHHQAPVPLVQGEAGARQKRSLAERLSRGQDLRELDLTGADLRGLDLSGVDCSGALMEACNLSGVSMKGARFVGSVLAHADLSHAQAAECDFTDANLGKAKLTQTHAERADFTRCTLEQAQLTGAKLSGARFMDAKWMGVRLDQADLGSADLEDCVFLETNLSGTRFDGSRLKGAAFISTDLQGTSWNGAQGADVSFVNVTCPDGQFRGAILPGSRWVGTVDLAGACFEGADLGGAYFGQGTRLTGAVFDGLRADGANFSGCLLERTTWRGARIREGAFRSALLNGADLAGADLMGAMLTGAVLHGAQLQGCNGYAADFARIQIDELTRLDDVYSPKARTVPRWRPPEGDV
jgi:uncharacterized protein YjbI with pentapeptide repeats